jgi:hypothetical protein
MTPLKYFLINLVLFILSFIIADFDSKKPKFIDYVAGVLFFTLFGNLIWCIIYYVKF